MRGETASRWTRSSARSARCGEQPAPLVKTPTVTEEIPDVRFGQVDPRPAALAAVAEQGRTANGRCPRRASGRRPRDLREPGGDLDMSVAGLLHARERLDFSIRAAQDIGDCDEGSGSPATRAALDAQLKSVPEVATADANFAANSAPLEPFTGNNPLGRVVRRDDLPAHGDAGQQVSGHRQRSDRGARAPGPAGAGLARGPRSARRDPDPRPGRRARTGSAPPMPCAERCARTPTSSTSSPRWRDRLSSLVFAHDGMERVTASPLGQIAQRPDVKHATSVAVSAEPSSHGEIASAMQALVRNDPRSAQMLARYYLESTFNAATAEKRGYPRSTAVQSSSRR